MDSLFSLPRVIRLFVYDLAIDSREEVKVRVQHDPQGLCIAYSIKHPEAGYSQS
jgi:hypothetical protein